MSGEHVEWAIAELRRMVEDIRETLAAYEARKAAMPSWWKP